MKLITFSTISLLTTFSLTTSAIGLGSPKAVAENFAHLNQLLSTKQCFECDLSNAGLVMADLRGANLSGANLSGANLSQANLSGANLSGANLSGTSLFGANLNGANLEGAILNGTDLRQAYLYNAVLTNTSLTQAYVQGTLGIPVDAGSPEQFHLWGMAEAEGGNYQKAIAYYSRAISLDENYAPAYLARGMMLFRLGNDAAATQDGQTAAELFQQQQNSVGYQASMQLVQGIEVAREAEASRAGSQGVERWLGGIGSVLIKLFF